MRAPGGSRPVVGVIGSHYMVENRFAVQLVGERNLFGLAEVCGALPLCFAGCPQVTDRETLLSMVDGILLTGARANVHPSHFGMPEDPRHEPYDLRRDALALDLVRVCVDRGIPILGICRGFQEMNVAFGGTLWQHVAEQPGLRVHHEDSTQPLDVQYGPAHEVILAPGGELERLAGRSRIMVNSVHHQGVRELAPGLIAEAHADDGLVEAFRVAGARRFALAVQWHPEWKADRDDFSIALFKAFGAAARERANEKNNR